MVLRKQKKKGVHHLKLALLIFSKKDKMKFKSLFMDVVSKLSLNPE